MALHKDRRKITIELDRNQIRMFKRFCEGIAENFMIKAHEADGTDDEYLSGGYFTESKEWYNLVEIFEDNLKFKKNEDTKNELNT